MGIPANVTHIVLEYIRIFLMDCLLHCVNILLQYWYVLQRKFGREDFDKAVQGCSIPNDLRVCCVLSHRASRLVGRHRTRAARSAESPADRVQQ